MTSAALLTWSNAVVPRLPDRPWVRTAANLAATGTLVLAVRAGGCSWRELGLDRSTWRVGFRWGAGSLVASGTAYVLGLALPGARRALLAPAAQETGARQVAVHALVHIPLGTVLSEEVAFRGALHAMTRRPGSARVAVLVTSGVFGLWHVQPALRDERGACSSRPLQVAGSVVLTAVGGAVFGWLRQRSGSVIAPVGLHLGTNGVGLVAAALAAARGPLLDCRKRADRRRGSARLRHLGGGTGWWAYRGRGG